MKPFLLSTIIALTAIPAHAGGPVIIEGDPEVATPRMSKNERIALALLGVVMVAVLLGNGGPCNGPEETPPTDGGC